MNDQVNHPVAPELDPNQQDVTKREVFVQTPDEIGAQEEKSR